MLLGQIELCLNSSHPLWTVNHVFGLNFSIRSSYVFGLAFSCLRLMPYVFGLRTSAKNGLRKSCHLVTCFFR